MQNLKQEMAQLLVEGIPFPSSIVSRDEAKDRLFDFLIDEHSEKYAIWNDYDIIRVEKYNSVVLEVDCLEDRFLLRRTPGIDEEEVREYILDMFQSIIKFTNFLQDEITAEIYAMFSSKKTYEERCLEGDKFPIEKPKDDLTFEWI